MNPEINEDEQSFFNQPLHDQEINEFTVKKCFSNQLN